MTEAPADKGTRASHWDTAYESRGTEGLSWYQSEPRISLELVEALGVPLDGPIVDVGGGASFLADRLVDRGWRDVTVLDISEAALAAARERLGGDIRVTWLHDDLLGWLPTRRYALWHDRAVFHFLVEAAERETYLDLLRAAVVPGGSVILATFALDGPEYCSGLPVARYSADDLARVLADRGFEVRETRREQHTTPWGAIQTFTWVGARATQ